MSLVSHRVVKQFQSKCNFSIDHILNVAGEKNKVDGCSDSDEEKKFEWLNCTRYRPPKLQRQKRRDGIQRRKPGRNPRIPFSSSQVAFLEAKFIRTPYLSSSDVTQLAANLNLSETRVKIWFQNRRARERRDRETKSKSSSKESTSQKSSELKESLGFERMLVDRCYIPITGDKMEESQEDQQINLYNSVRRINFHDNNNYTQLFSPLDLSDRHLLCK